MLASYTKLCRVDNWEELFETVNSKSEYKKEINEKTRQ